MANFLRNAIVGIGCTVTASRAAGLHRSAVVGIGCTTTATRLGGLTRSGVVGIGLTATALRMAALSRQGAVTAAPALTVSRSIIIVRTAIVGIGLSVTASRSVALTRSMNVSIACLTAAGRGGLFGRSAAVGIGCTALSGRNWYAPRFAFLCIGPWSWADRAIGLTRTAPLLVTNSAISTPPRIFYPGAVRAGFMAALRSLVFQAVGSFSGGGAGMLAVPIGAGSSYIGPLELDQPFIVDISNRLGPAHVTAVSVTAQVRLPTAPPGPAGLTPAASDFVQLALLAGFVSGFTGITPGTGYSSPPAVALDPPAYPGTQASAQAALAGSGAGSVTPLQGGLGYIIAPGVSFSGGGGSGAAATAVLTMSGAVLRCGNQDQIAGATYFLVVSFTLSDGRIEEIQIPGIPCPLVQ